MSEMEMDRIIAKCAKFFGVQVEDVMSPCKYTEVVRARHAAWAILRWRGLGLKELARKFNKDHTSVMYGAEKGQRYPLNKIMEVVL